MDIREVVKEKENYGNIVTYYKDLKKIETHQMVELIDVIDDMSEEIYEHYRALQDIVRQAISDIIKRRQKEGDFSFLTDCEKEQFSYTIKKASDLGVLLWEKYEEFNEELKKS